MMNQSLISGAERLAVGTQHIQVTGSQLSHSEAGMREQCIDGQTLDRAGVYIHRKHAEHPEYFQETLAVVRHTGVVRGREAM